MSFATLNGINVFGQGTKVQMVQNPTAQQIAEFFGMSGVFQLAGGTRGRHFMITSALVGVDLPTITAAEAAWDTGAFGNYADGVARTLVTPRGVTYANVVYRGEYQPMPGDPLPGYWPGGAGWVLRYNLILHGLT
jgi:hypothetical protein